MSEKTALIVANLILFLLLFIIMIIVSFTFADNNSANVSSRIRLKKSVIRILANFLIPALFTYVITNMCDQVFPSMQDVIVQIIQDAFSSSDPSDALDPSDTPDPSDDLLSALDRFEKHVTNLSDGVIQYSSPQFGIKIELPDNYECIEYNNYAGYTCTEETKPESIKLNYIDLELSVDIEITNSTDFGSIGSYFELFSEKYAENSGLYKVLYQNRDIPYCVFSFYRNDEKEIFYELTYKSDDVWCTTRFCYPAYNKKPCDPIIRNYLKSSVLTTNS